MQLDDRLRDSRAETDIVRKFAPRQQSEPPCVRSLQTVAVLGVMLVHGCIPNPDERNRSGAKLLSREARSDGGISYSERQLLREAIPARPYSA
jgi:hypothetical protein